MKTITEKLDSLKESDIWTFAKQSTDFDDAFRAVKLFSEIPNRKDINLEQYFEDNYSRYGISTHRHRVLIISQLFGLLTKTPFFSRGGKYSEETPTEMFELLNKCTIGDVKYNTYKTEQLLKLKANFIINTSDIDEQYSILILLYIFIVLFELKKRHAIDKITLGQLNTYVMTCKNFNELEETIEILSQNPPVSNLNSAFKDKSRVRTLIEENISLFVFENDSISINNVYEQYFFENFVLALDFDVINNFIVRDADYSYFLYTHQDFNVNLIDKLPIVLAPTRKRKITEKVKKLAIDKDDKYDDEYVKEVDEIKAENINDKIAEDAFKNVLTRSIANGRVIINKNPIFGRIAIKKANYQCCYDISHATFLSKRNLKQYMEAHHLIPIAFAEQIWNSYHINIDCVENLISLCPTCHRAIHYGDKDCRRNLITNLFLKQQIIYKKIGLNISLADILKIYEC